ncbi:MAG: elongation factor P [Elusimicrobiaceae bacterium]|jgi:elongation factor P|nr:elongation factor P [Elusimicrobiaceae bacterium]MBT3954587.1 elongation factor P [Elusimicrobiaceae bacterium]MBT4007895.1 elongation factor P [Elusimicrobiaceae bacterium]MBT4402581.1 elongation factor P [Elusimicrobiaceae bacterium]MBT4439909.1 elongation factor P [Elusimicrobiaceae bacterium]
MLSTSELKENLIFEDENGEIVQVISHSHHRKSQARAVVRLKLKNFSTGVITERSYRPEDKFNEVAVQKRPQTYLYTTGDNACFMDATNYEQYEVPVSKIKNEYKYLTDNMEVEGLFINEAFFSVVLPVKMTFKIDFTEPGVKGDTVSNTFKPATLENGIEIRVPLFINEGDKVVIDTRTGEYVERASK